MTHEELISKAMAAYENSSIDYGMDEADMVNKIRNMSDAAIYGFIAYCEKN